MPSNRRAYGWIALVAAGLSAVALGVYWFISQPKPAPYSATQLIRKAKLYLNDGEPQKASETLALLLPNQLNGEAILLHVEANYFRREQLSESDSSRLMHETLALCDRLESAGVPPVLAHFWTGNVYLALYRASDAEAEYRQCLETSDRLFSDAATQLARVYLSQRRFDKAIPLIWQRYLNSSTVARGPLNRPVTLRDPILLVELQSVRYGQWKAEHDVERIQRFYEASPEDYETRLAYARSLIGLEKLEDARKLLDELVDEDSDHLPARLEWLRCAIDQLDQSTLRTWLANPIPAAPHDALYHRLLGEAYVLTGELHAAVGAFNRSLELDPFDAQTHYALGRCLARQRKREEATEHLQKSQSLNEARDQLLNTLTEMREGKVTAQQSFEAAKQSTRMGDHQTAQAWLATAAKLGMNPAIIAQWRAQQSDLPKPQASSP